MPSVLLHYHSAPDTHNLAAFFAVAHDLARVDRGLILDAVPTIVRRAGSVARLALHFGAHQGTVRHRLQEGMSAADQPTIAWAIRHVLMRWLLNRNSSAYRADGAGFGTPRRVQQRRAWAMGAWSSSSALR